MHSRVIRGIALPATLAVVLLAAGCGSSKHAPSKAEFLQKGNAVCKKGTDQINQAANKAFPKSGGKPTKAKLIKFATATIIPSVQSQIDGVKALGAPKGDEAKVKAIVTSAQAALDKGKKDPALLVANGSGPFTEANKLANGYGLKACGG